MKLSSNGLKSVLAVSFIFSVHAFVVPRQSALDYPTTSLHQQVSSQDSPDGRAKDPLQIKCAGLRAINPRTKTYKEFREDLDKGGMDPDLLDLAGWGMIPVQQGFFKAFFKGVGLDTLDLDGYVERNLSHKDLMWPYREEVAALLKSKADENGQISVLNLWEAKRFTTDKYDKGGAITFASYNEIPLIFLRCGGDTSTGKVDLKPVLDLFDGKDTGPLGRCTVKGFKEVLKILDRDAPERSPSIFRTPAVLQHLKFIVSTVIFLVSKKLRKLFGRSG